MEIIIFIYIICLLDDFIRNKFKIKEEEKILVLNEIELLEVSFLVLDRRK